MELNKNEFVMYELNEGAFLIGKHYKDGVVHIAFILQDESGEDCFVQTISENFQDYVLTYEDFKDFIYLVDSAYFELKKRFRK